MLRLAVATLALVVFMGVDAVAAERPPWPARKRRIDTGPLRPGVHQVKDPRR